MKSLDTMMAQATVENMILGFVKDPPDSDFQLGYLSALSDVLSDLGGEDYAEFVFLCRRNMGIDV